jgi:presqualene diphosphate synthase
MRPPVRAAVPSMPRCVFFRARAARRCLKSTPSAALWTTLRTKRGHATPAGKRSPNGGAISARFIQAQPCARARLRGLATAIHAFGLRREDFWAVIDGMEMDVDADIRAPDLATLDLYCDRVASAVGRLSARTFGMPQAEGRCLAHHLGRALQLTNILRDLDDDAALGRLYLPCEDLRAAGISEADPREVLANPALGRACAPVIARAKTHFGEAAQIMARCPRASVRAPRIMADVYQAILAGLERRGFAGPRQKIRAPRHRIVLALLRYGLI